MSGIAMGSSQVISSLIGSDASRHAANQQADAAKNAAQMQYNMFQQIQKELGPFRQYGQSVLPQLKNMLSGDPATMQATLQAMPGYQFALNQGLQGVQNSAAARGLGSSGAALRGAADYTTGLAQQNYGNYFNQLMAAAGLGESAASQTGNYATAAGGNIGNSLMAAGNAQASGTLGSANAINNSLNNIGQYAMMNRYMGGGGGGSSNGVFFNMANWAQGSPYSDPAVYDAANSVSDRRLKEDIKPVGKLDNGLTVYSYRYKGDTRTQIGLMADEVENIHPEAVSTHESGYKMVNYAKAIA